MPQSHPGRPRLGNVRVQFIVPQAVYEALKQQEVITGKYRTRIAADILTKQLVDINALASEQALESGEKPAMAWPNLPERRAEVERLIAKEVRFDKQTCLELANRFGCSVAAIYADVELLGGKRIRTARGRPVKSSEQSSSRSEPKWKTELAAWDWKAELAAAMDTGGASDLHALSSDRTYRAGLRCRP